MFNVIILMFFYFQIFSLAPSIQVSNKSVFLKENNKYTPRQIDHFLRTQKKQENSTINWTQKTNKHLPSIQSTTYNDFLKYLKEKMAFVFNRCLQAEQSESACSISIAFQVFSLYYSLYWGPQFSFLLNGVTFILFPYIYLKSERLSQILGLFFTLNRLISFPLPFIYAHLSHLIGYMITNCLPHQLSEKKQNNIAGIVHSIVFLLSNNACLFSRIFYSFSSPY